MLDLLVLFESKCEEKSTIKKLILLANDQHRWSEAHALFSEIRKKTLIAEKHGDTLKDAQYCFEEICAKTLYNLSHEPAPFDPDSPFWVLPLAIQLGQKLGVSELDEISPLLKIR